MRKGLVSVNPVALKTLRRMSGLSQVALAEKANVSESLVALIETGRRQPSEENAKALATAMDVPVEAFATITEDEPPPVEAVPA